ncbi:hypothetical protein AN641_05840 [Candidatus Epulonipiscioides gigas]|nr:hypothetical protein AN641_05840 [Epulopiscium sp. SCG-C07WGA-EpuloA2]
MEKNKTIVINKLCTFRKYGEHVDIKNTTDTAVALTGWKIVSNPTGRSYIFKEFVLEANSIVSVGECAKNQNVDFYWVDSRKVWSNTDSFELYNYDDKLIDIKKFNSAEEETIAPVEEKVVEVEVKIEVENNARNQNVEITALNSAVEYGEYVEITNNTDTEVELTGWKIVALDGKCSYTFKKFVLGAGKTVKVGECAKNQDVDFYWVDSRAVWSNKQSIKLCKA